MNLTFWIRRLEVVWFWNPLTTISLAGAAGHRSVIMPRIRIVVSRRAPGTASVAPTSAPHRNKKNPNLHPAALDLAHGSSSC
jgi:hypothetical protein